MTWRFILDSLIDLGIIAAFGFVSYLTLAVLFSPA